jgi:hypothetical protein
MTLNMEVSTVERLTYADILNKTESLLEQLENLGLLEMRKKVKELIGEATESGYFGGYSDAHWYMRGMEDGA